MHGLTKKVFNHVDSRSGRYTVTETGTCQVRCEEQMDVIKGKSVFPNKRTFRV